MLKDFEKIDFFTDETLNADPFPYYDSSGPTALCGRNLCMGSST